MINYKTNFKLLNSEPKMFIRTINGWEFIPAYQTQQGFWIPKTEIK